MGNNNSSQHRRYGHHHQNYNGQQWSQSLDDSHITRDPRNRMKKGYFPAMGPPGARGGGLIPAAKVLPKVDPVAAAMRLKPTSNGAILNGGGTISGRKLQMMHELQMGGGQGPVSGGFQDEEQLMDVVEEGSGRRRHASSSSMHGIQPVVLSGGLSTPNLLAIEDEFPQSNDFSRRSQRSIGGHRIILDKPSKGEGFGGSQPDLTRYVEDDNGRGRSASPPEPNSFTLIGESPAKKQIRTKKKYPAPAPPPVDQGQNEQKKNNRLFKTKAESKLSGSSAERHSIGGSTSSSSGGERKVLADSSIILTPLKSEKPWMHKMFSAPADQNDLNKDDIKPKKKVAAPPVPEVKTQKSKPPAPTGPKSTSSNKTSTSSTTAISVDEGRKKITTSTTTHTTSSKSSTQILVEPKDTQLPKYYYEEKREEGEKSKFYFGMDDSKAATKTKPRTPSPVKAESHEVKNIVVEMKLNEEAKKVKNETPKPELESNSLFLSRQQKVMAAATQEPKREETSFSDLSSSSDVDIPMLIRPTLPQKRMDLPRFSPCEAWRALDSPRASGRSLSSEDGFSYEDRIRRYTRPYAPPRTGTERSGDSGISAGDTASPAHNIPGEMMEQRELHSRSTTTSQNKIQIRKSSMEEVECWTPEHDLDESSSEFEHDLAAPQEKEKRLQQPQEHLPLGSQTPPKFTTRSHLFAKNPTRSGNGSSHAPTTPEPERYLHRQHLYSKSSKLGAGKLRQRQATRDPTSDDEGPRSENQRNEGYAKKKYQSDFVGLDTNWFLSRSEPNSLNVLCSEGKSPKLSVAPGLLDEIFPQGDASKGHLVPECRSEIGYGPSSMTFLSSGEESRSRHGKHFSHIMYLPSYDSRRASPYYPNSRRTKSVDHLDESRLFRKTTEFTSLNAEQRWSRRDFLEVQSADDWETQEEVEYFNESTDEPLEPSNGNAIEYPSTAQVKPKPSAEELEREQKRRKYKFQSTLRVQERKKLEEQLAREARDMEEQRLREVEAMKRVEEEFQRKRAQKEAREIIVQASSNNKALPKLEQRIHEDWNVQQHHNNANNYRNANLSQRQEPEGAPAPGSDLRKELIHASKKRSGRPPSEMMQELSEYRQESPREYYDYRRSPRATSASPARFMESSSEIYPNARRVERRSHTPNRYKTTTVHPEVVCDIPVKPSPFMVNFSRHSGSSSNLLIEDLPNGSYAASGPPSVISDNYRRDWAHHHNAVRGGGGPGRASSIGSLHSGHMSEVLRQSTTDLSAVHDLRSAKSPLVHKYSSSPPSSPMPPLSSSNASEFTDFDKDSSSVITSSHSPSSGVFKIQPYKSREYRPVAFKPAGSNNFKLASTVVQ